MSVFYPLAHKGRRTTGAGVEMSVGRSGQADRARYNTCPPCPECGGAHTLALVGGRAVCPERAHEEAREAFRRRQREATGRAHPGFRGAL